MRNVCLNFVLILSACPVAQAAVMNVSAVQRDNSGGGARLANYVTNDILIDFEGNLRAQQMLLTLSQGSVYQHSGLFGGNVAPPSIFTALEPAMAYDTFVTFGGPTLPANGGQFANASDFIQPGGAVNIPGGTTNGKFDTTSIDYAWAPGAGKNITQGTDFMTARITLSNDAIGTLKYFGSTAAGTGEPLLVDGWIANGVISFVRGDPPIVRDVYRGFVDAGARILHSFMTIAGTPPITWSNVQVTESPGGLVNNAPTLTADGQFAWNTNNAESAGMYVFDVTATNHFGNDTASLTVNIVYGGAELTPPAPVDAYLGRRPQGSMINHTFTIWSGAEPVTWSDLAFLSAPGALMNAPTLTSTGSFVWDTHGSPLGTYSFSVTATNVFGSDTGTLQVVLIPEPASWMLVAIAALAIWFGRKRQIPKTNLPDARPQFSL